eukprot:TRINITY_DN6767_c0_g6_i1.p1 TRINITY_DN6767_c0_g6~~TRINITY_DN6767_c0_g6_i1.p1  ORF type:complete len:247 (+),score=37.79 TRINITY_DN6767_c0_g6_i1:80-742(+)
MHPGVDGMNADAIRNPQKTLFSRDLEERAVWLRTVVEIVERAARVQEVVPSSVARGSGVEAVRRLQRIAEDEDGWNDSTLSPSGAQHLQPKPPRRPSGSEGGRLHGVMVDAQRWQSVKPEPRPLSSGASIVDVPKRQSAKPEPRAKSSSSSSGSSSSNAAMVRVPEEAPMNSELGTNPGDANHRSIEALEGAHAGVGGAVVAQLADAPTGATTAAANAAD